MLKSSLKGTEGERGEGSGQGQSRLHGVALSLPLPPSIRSDHEVWLTIGQGRVLARLRAAGPSWMHVFIEEAVNVGTELPFTFVLRGAEGGVIDGLSRVISCGERDGKVIVRLRLMKLATTGGDELLARFAREILNDGAANPLIVNCNRGVRLAATSLKGAGLDATQTLPLGADACIMEDPVVVSKRALWRDGKETTRAELIRSSGSGRRLLIRLLGPVPSAWATVRVELDVGCMGEPRPIQLVVMVVGTLSTDDLQGCHVVVRLLRWSQDTDRMLWIRWLRHQQRLDTSVVSKTEPEVTRTIRPILNASLPT